MMEIRFSLTPAERHAFLQDEVRQANPRKAWLDLLRISAATACLAGAGLAVLHDPERPEWQAAELFFVAGLFALAYLGRVLSRHAARADAGASPGDYRLVLSPAGVFLSGAGRPGFVPWPAIRAFHSGEHHWHCQVEGSGGIVVPKAALPDPAERARFEALVRQFWAEHPDNRGRSLSEGPAFRSAVGRWLADLGANLRAGYRCAVFRPAKSGDFRAGAVQLALLLALQLFLYGTADYFLNGPEPGFNPYGLSDYSVSVVLFLLSGVAIGGLLTGTADLVRLLVMIAASQLVAYLAYFLVYAGGSEKLGAAAGHALTALYGVWVVWNLAIVHRVVVLWSGCPRGAALLPVGVFALFNLAIAHALPNQDLFLPAEDDAASIAAGPDIDGEDIFYRQPALLDEASGNLAAGRPGVTELYFVGFAGESDEPVFAHEVEFARDLFDRRFGTAGRSIALVNSPETADRLPLANAHNLESALRAVAQRMNRNEDVLFLFLTSHGSRDHRLSVQFAPLPLNDLPATRLKALLDASGIRHRVIVVSACYSGGFLDVLKDENSLILTAASRDRTSFGCGTEADFTYFGQAYFVEALQDTRSFIEAFGKAQRWIAVREKAEGKEPSLPQLHVGAGIVPKLRELEGRKGS
jgi:hypothetical protein